MAKGMDEAECLRLQTIVEKSGTIWKLTGTIIKNKGTYRLGIRHKKTGYERLLSSLLDWNILIGEQQTTDGGHARVGRFQEDDPRWR